MHIARERRLVGALTIAVTLSPLVPVVAYTVHARTPTDSSCVSVMAFDSGARPASVSLRCPESSSASSPVSTIEIRNIGP